MEDLLMRRRELMNVENSSGAVIDPYVLMPFTIVASEPLIITFNGQCGLNFTEIRKIKYKINDGNWLTYDYENDTMQYKDISLLIGDRLSIIGDGRFALSQSDDGFYLYIDEANYTAHISFSLEGNLCSLFDGDNFATCSSAPDYCLANALLFGRNGICGDISNIRIPVTTVGKYAFYRLFYSLTGQDTTLDGDISNLLPATNLGEGCYYQMFYRRGGLTTAPELPATTLATDCYRQMFGYCSSLTIAPVLPATTLVSNCYYGMFQRCSSLNYIKAMFTTTPGTNYTRNWVTYVASSGTFVKNSAANWNVTGNNGIPTGWTVQTASS